MGPASVRLADVSLALQLLSIVNLTTSSGPLRSRRSLVELYWSKKQLHGNGFVRINDVLYVEPGRVSVRGFTVIGSDGQKLITKLLTNSLTFLVRPILYLKN